jgi:hypothetical protein
MTSTSNNIQLTEELKSRIKVALKQVCVEHHTTPNKQLLKDMPGRITLACPYCGDSHEDDTKKRGNMYWDTLQYHCYNCSHHTNLYGLLKDHEVRMPNTGDSFTIIDYIKENKQQVSQEQVLQNQSLASVQELALTVDEFKQVFAAKEIEPGEWIWFQLKERLLHTKASEFLFSPKGNRLWILNMGINGKIIGAQSRRMKGYGSRYLTYDLPKIYEEWNKPLELEPEVMTKLAKASTLFGIMQVNFQQPVTLFEGPIDAKFMHNSIALATAGRSTEEFDEMATVRYMFDNDATGKKKMIEKLKRGRPVFMWSKFLDDFKLDTYNIKDLNDLIKVCYKQKSTAWKQIENYFTSSDLDLWYV